MSFAFFITLVLFLWNDVDLNKHDCSFSG